MAETLALPAHVEPKGFDVDAAVADLLATPKQDYSSKWTEEEREPPPPASNTPASGTASPEVPGSTDPASGGKTDGLAAAKEFIEVYDTLQAGGFKVYSGAELDKFLLDKDVKDRAAHHLAKGLALMGNPELPWWLGLVVCIAPPTFFNWMAARDYLKAAKEKAQKAASKDQPRRDNVIPFSAPPSQPVRDQQEPKLVHFTGAEHPPKQRTVHGQCEVCGKPVYKKGRKVCGQSCSGKLTAMRKSQAPIP